ncbi:MAG: beta-lactamase family protein [Bacteroidetes bacterium]|nr:beta-lactamase family protein [Bacteroidota bacterium]
MKISLTILLAIIQAPIFCQDLSKKLDNYLSATNRRNKFNGTALIAYKNEIILYKGYGFKNKERKILNDTATIYRIGSITKSFTAATILNLYDKGLLSLDDPLNKYIPDYPSGNKITIRNLLTHTSGIPEYLFAKGYDKEDFSKPISIERLISFFKNGPLIFKPGEKMSYSNSNYILLAYTIEVITHKKYELVVRNVVLDPLQMNHSGFDFKNLADTNKAFGYNNIFKRNGSIQFVSDSSHEVGGGSIYSTAMDLYKWDRSFYSNKILRHQTYEQVITPFKDHYGYGWFVDTAYGRLNVFHGGGIPGFVSHIQRFPIDNLCIILLSNNSYCDLNEMGNKLAAIIFDIPFEKAIY